MAESESGNTNGRGEEPLFNIGAVSRMTDIHMATLRIWERRYDFPHPARTAGGQRLYSQHEIVRMKWVKKHVDEGMQVSKAIQALNRLEQAGETLYTTLTPPSALPLRADDISVASYHTRLLDALLAHDAEGATQTIADASLIHPLESLIFEMIQPAFVAIGEAWQTGHIDVATEHFATNLLRQTLLLWIHTGPPAFHVSPVILACAPGELHEGSLLMLGVLLKRLRWPIVYLGQSVPLESLASFVDALAPSMLIFVAMSQETARALRDWPLDLPRVAQAGRPIVAYGGQAFSQFPELAEEVPGVLLGHSLRAGLDTTNRLLHELHPLLR